MRVCRLILLALPLPLVAQTEAKPELDQGFQWKPAMAESLLSASIANVERFAREEDTRDSIHGPFIKNYFRSIQNTHGWDDGDALYTSYVLHPMQGSVADYVERQNDPKFRKVEFGTSQLYWTSMMRSFGFSTLSSVFWSAGPLGEAGLGNVQLHSAPGVVDLVGTEVMGLGWTVGEDAIDRYVIRRIEGRVESPVIRALVRSVMNPTRAYANILRLRVPWFRDSRSLWVRRSDAIAKSADGPAFRPSAWPATHAIEFEMHPLTQQFLGKNAAGGCLGAGGEFAIQMTNSVALAIAMDGCRADGRPQNITDDEFDYMIGPRWTGVTAGHWRHYAELLVGGIKITRLQIDAAKRQELTEAARKNGKPKPGLDEYSTESDANGFTLEAQSGISYQLKDGLELRVANIGFQHSYLSKLAGYEYGDGLRFSTGVAFRLGPWRR